MNNVPAVAGRGVVENNPHAVENPYNFQLPQNLTVPHYLRGSGSRTPQGYLTTRTLKYPI